jgi:hypothetical protein
MWLKLAPMDWFFGYFHVFQVVEHIRTVLERLHKKMRFKKKIEKFHFWSFFANFSHILWSKNHVFKKVGSGVSKIRWVNKSLSMMWLRAYSPKSWSQIGVPNQGTKSGTAAPHGILRAIINIFHENHQMLKHLIMWSLVQVSKLVTTT